MNFFLKTMFVGGNGGDEVVTTTSGLGQIDGGTSIRTILDLCNNGAVQQIIRLIKLVLNAIQIFVPILLVVLGTIDLAKAVTTNDDKAVKEATSTFARRIGFAVAVFFVITIITIVFQIISADPSKEVTDNDKVNWITCWNSAGVGANK